MKEWCLGFVIMPQHVVLLKKTKTMHVGLWNGLGGKIEEGESAIDAMRRESLEEAKLSFDWKLTGYLGSGRSETDAEPWRVFLYAADGVGKTLELSELAEITANYADKTLGDVPYRFQYEELTNLPLAPYSKTLIQLCQDKIRYPDTRLVELRLMT